MKTAPKNGSRSPIVRRLEENFIDFNTISNKFLLRSTRERKRERELRSRGSRPVRRIKKKKSLGCRPIADDIKGAMVPLLRDVLRRVVEMEWHVTDAGEKVSVGYPLRIC